VLPSGLWSPVVLGAVIRIALWIWLPASRFASDEESYYRAGTVLAGQGQQDLFWPPMTGWLIALITLVAGPSVTVIRLAWVMMDIGCLIAVRSLAWRLASDVSDAVVDHQTGRAALARQFTLWATLGYALYLPAVSFAQFATSETPALLQLLVVLLLLTRHEAGRGTFVLAGVLTGALALTRPSLLPLLVILPIVIAWQRWRANRVAHAALLAIAGALVVGGVVIKNWWMAGDATIARNSAYNLYIGNRDFYAEDLNLFSPRATKEQIEFRREFFRGQEAYPTGTPQELQRQALAWIAAHPGTFARRALGRLGRVFVPRTDVLELVGGERSVGVFAPQSIALLAIANLQWTVVLFGGLIGLFALRHIRADHFELYAASIVGALVLCLIAISKPRYSFVIDPLLILGACVFLTAPGRIVRRLPAIDRWVLAALFAFLIWAWIAWTIFALTSRS
jgi:4-amino-4-deoxy-L-arabinose transferase-like glycosyltransferase